MIWTDKSELPLIQHVCQSIVTDAAGTGLKQDTDYESLAPGLFSNVRLAITHVFKPADDHTVIKASFIPGVMTLTIGTRRTTAPIARAVSTLGGALAHELVHNKQYLHDATSFLMASSIQRDWRASLATNPSPHEWLTGYYGTIYEFEAHAEQIAYEIWLEDTIAGLQTRKSQKLAQIGQIEPWQRISSRLAPTLPATASVGAWLNSLETKINEALSLW